MNGGSKRSSGFIRPQRVSQRELNTECGAVGVLCPALPSQAMLTRSHLALELALNSVPHNFGCRCGGCLGFLTGLCRLPGWLGCPHHGVSLLGTLPCSCGIQPPPIPCRGPRGKRHLWAILASTARVITISNFAELYAFGAYYKHQ